MKKKVFIWLLSVVFMTIGMNSCKDKEEVVDEQTTEQKEDSVKEDDNQAGEQGDDDQTQKPTSFQRKQLIEHFTGQDCGYCPSGMDYIEEAIADKKDQFIWVSNHSGYMDDEFTLKESKQLATDFDVEGAPSIMVNRATSTYTEERKQYSSIVFHPYYLYQVVDNLQTTALVNVELENAFDASSRELSVTVKSTALDERTNAKLVLLLKESGLHGYQSDYENTWEGWSDFIHNNAVRKYILPYNGEEITYTNGEFSQTYSATLDDAWKADNCMVVAFIIGTDDTVLNAEEQPVVSGTMGGADIVGGGVTEVEIPDTYPEYNDMPTQGQDVVFTTAGYYLDETMENNNKVFAIQAFNSSTFVYNRQQVVPFAILYFIVNSKSKSIDYGTYPLVLTGKVNTAIAGYRDDENHAIGGSTIYLANYAYLTSYNYLYGEEWLLTEGNIEVTNKGFSYEAKTMMGTTIKGSFSGTLTNYDASSAHRAKMKKEVNTCIKQ